MRKREVIREVREAKGRRPAHGGGGLVQEPETLVTVAVTVAVASNRNPLGAFKIIVPVPISPGATSLSAGPLNNV